MHMFGFGIPGQGFHSLKIPGLTKEKTSEFVGLIQIKRGKVDSERLEEELKHMFDKNWAWRVHQISDTEFLAAFPNKVLLDTFSRSKGIELALYNISATVTPSSMDLAASSILQEGWVLLSNVPTPAKTVEAVTLITQLLGEVVVVDELSLIKEGPIGVKLRARDILKLRGFVEFFVEGVGYEVKVTPESNGTRSVPPPPPPKKT